MQERYSLKKTSYKPKRGLLLDESDSLISINAVLKPWGFRIRYWGYERIMMWYVYEFVTTKSSYKPLTNNLVMLYHATDMTVEEWRKELVNRLNKQSHQDYINAWRRQSRAKANRAKNYQYKRRRKGVNSGNQATLSKNRVIQQVRGVWNIQPASRGFNIQRYGGSRKNLQRSA